MERFTLILSCGGSLESVKEKLFYKKLNLSQKEKEFKWRQRSEQESALLMALTVGHKQFIAYCDLDTLNSGNSLLNLKWLELSSLLINEDLDDFGLIASLLDHLQESNETSNIEKSNTKAYEDPVDCLHQLADALPIPGSYILEVVIITSDKEMIPPEECISLYGFLERLQLWHQARINVLDLNDVDLKETDHHSRSPFESWKDVIDFGRIKKGGFNLTIRPSVLWSGGLCLRQENGCHTRISGLELRNGAISNACLPERLVLDDQQSKLMLSDEIEVLKVIEDYHIPLHVLCHTKLKLTLRQDCDESTIFFFNMVQESEAEGLCFLGCIFYNVVENHTKTPQVLNTKKWLDYINDKKTDYLVPDDLKKKLPKRCMIIIRGSHEKESLNIFFVKDSEHFCGYGLSSFLSFEHSRSQYQVEGNFGAKWKLPLLSDDDVLRLQLDAFQDLCHRLEECAATENNDDIADQIQLVPLFANLSSERLTFIDADDISIEDVDYSIEYCAADLISPSQWPERLSWNNQELSASISLRRSLKRFQSAEDHMKLKGIPVHAEKQSEDVPESFTQMRQLFDSTGRPLRTDLKSIPLVADRLFKQLPTEDTIRNLPFKKAKQFVGHGIHYCLDSHNSLKLDAKLVRIQERFISDGTSCSWTPNEKSKSKIKEKLRREEKRSLVITDKQDLKSASDRKTDQQNKKPRKVSKGDCESLSKAEKKQSTAGKQKEADDVSSSPKKESRSQRHQRRLKIICEGTLQKYGKLKKDDPVFDKCVTRLYTLCKSFLKDLKTSEGLVDEMKRIAKSNVNQVVEFEKRGR